LAGHVVVAVDLPIFSLRGEVIHQLNHMLKTCGAESLSLGAPQIGSGLNDDVDERRYTEICFGRRRRGLLPDSIAQPNAGPQVAHDEPPVATQAIGDRSLVGKR
jgi:hypothetical protein